MADNAIAYNNGSPVTFATDDIGGGVQAARYKMMLGADGVDDGNVSSTNPVPVKDIDVKAAIEAQGDIEATMVVSLTKNSYIEIDCAGKASVTLFYIGSNLVAGFYLQYSINGSDFYNLGGQILQDSLNAGVTYNCMPYKKMRLSTSFVLSGTGTVGIRAKPQFIPSNPSLTLGSEYGDYLNEASVMMVGGYRYGTYEGVTLRFSDNLEVKVSDADVLNELRFTLAADTQSSVSSSVTSVTLAAENWGRKSFTIFNNSTAILWVTFGATATQATAKFAIAAGGFYEMPKPIFTGEISGIWAAANGNASVYEGI